VNKGDTRNGVVRRKPEEKDRRGHRSKAKPGWHRQCGSKETSEKAQQNQDVAHGVSGPL